MKNIFRRPIALPQDHGSWVFLLSPLLIGLSAGETFHIGSLALVFAALAAFLIRQPVTVAIKVYSGRKSKRDLPAARFWIFSYGIIAILSITELIFLGYTTVLLLAIPAIPVFGWHLWLVSKHDERKKAGIEILATGVLALAAPAAFWIGKNSYDSLGWTLWVLTWFQSAASIVYAYLRLEQRQWKFVPSIAERLKAGQRALAYTIFNVVLVVVLGALGNISIFICLPYLIQLEETLWGTVNPATGAKPVQIGVRQLIVSTLFTILFVITWR